MEFASLLTITASPTASTVTASRPFTTAFCLTMFARLIHDAHLGMINAADAWIPLFLASLLTQTYEINLPFWMINDATIAVLMLLAILEWYISQNSDIRVFLETAQTYVVKPGVSGVLQFGIIHGQSEIIFTLLVASLPSGLWHVLAQYDPSLATASLEPMALAQGGVIGWLLNGIALIWALLMAAMTWFISNVREGLIELLEDMDDGDNLGLMKLVSLVEGGWTSVLILCMFILPILALGLAGLTILALLLLRKWFERREERSKVTCHHCQSLMFPTALFCPTCREANHTVREVGVFGQAKSGIILDRTKQHLDLIARKRCPCCATRLPQRAVTQTCTVCGTQTFANIAEANSYIRALDAKLVPTVLICGALGMIPIIGIVPAVAYYRLSLIASLRAYIPRSVGCVTRWGIRIASVVLIALQSLGLGILTLPLMVLLNYYSYRKVLTSSFHRLPNNTASVFRTLTGHSVALPDGRSMVMPVATETLPSPITPAPQQKKADTGRLCSACDTVNLVSNKFCTRCGTALT